MKKFYNLIPGQPGEESRLYIDGEIVSGQDYTDFWTASRTKGAQTFRNELAQCGPVTVYINSPGGDVFAGAAMYSALLEHPHKVTVKIMGIAASAASVVAMAGDEVLISPVGYMMIHDPWSYVVGNAREMEHEAQVLREIGEGIVSAYQKKTGKTTDEIKKLLEAETYMNAQSAIENGFCDGLFTPDEDKAALAQASAPAASMRGRDYTPAAYMARMGAKRNTLTANASAITNSGAANGNLLFSVHDWDTVTSISVMDQIRSVIDERADVCAIQAPNPPKHPADQVNPVIAQALALVRKTTELAGDK